MNDTTQTAETSINPYHESYLAPYAPERSKIREFADRLRLTLSYRGASDLTENEVLGLAHASLAHGLNPYMGEIWALHGMGLMVGRSGWVKKLSEMGEKQKFTWWPSYQLLQHHQYPEYAVPDDVQIAFICELRRSDWMEIYTKTLKDLTEHVKLEYEMIIELLGKPPVVRGVGFIKKEEHFGKSTMPLAERAKKRAFAQACREIVYLPFESMAEGDIVDGQAIDEPNAIEGEFKVIDDAPKSNGNGRQETNQVEVPRRPMEPEALREYVLRHSVPSGHSLEKVTEKQIKLITSLTKGLFKGSATAEKDAEAYLEYVTSAEKIEYISKVQGSTLIELIKAEGDDAWGPSDVARTEAQRVLREVYKAEGQLSMFEQSVKTVFEKQEAKQEKKELPAEEKPKSELDKAFPRDKDGSPIEDEPEAKLEPKPKAKKASSTKKVEEKAEEKPAEPAKDNGEDPQLLALQRSKPGSWVMAAEWLNDEFGTDFLPSKLREEVGKKMNKKDFMGIPSEDGWPVAIEVAKEAAGSNG